MPSLLKAARSQIGRKLITGITGIGLLLFVIGHLSGNLSLFGAPDAFNEYSHFLENLGILLYTVEAVLLVFFIFHAYIGLNIWWRRRKARPENYEKYQSKEGPSKQSLSSKSMAFTGVVLLIFLVIHINHFKFGDTTTVVLESGEQARDLKGLVIDTFQKPLWAFGYTFVMLLLGTHLGHGIWSALTSLTMKNKKYSHVVHALSIILAVVLAVGFLFIPLYIYFAGPDGGMLIAN